MKYIISQPSFGGIRAYDDTQSDPQFLDTIPSLSDLYIIDRNKKIGSSTACGFVKKWVVYITCDRTIPR